MYVSFDNRSAVDIDSWRRVGIGDSDMGEDEVDDDGVFRLMSSRRAHKSSGSILSVMLYTNRSPDGVDEGLRLCDVFYFVFVVPFTLNFHHVSTFYVT